MSEKFTIVNKEVFSSEEKPKTSDGFRARFGFFKNSEDNSSVAYSFSETQDYKIVDKTRTKNNVIKPDPDYYPDNNYPNHAFVVETINQGSTPLLERMYRDSVYVIKNKNTSIIPEAYINFNTRYANYFSEFQVPNSNESLSEISDLSSLGQSYEDLDLEIQFFHPVERPEYEKIATSINAEVGLLNYYEAIGLVDSGINKTTEQLLTDSVNEYKFTLGKRSNFSNLILPTENREFLREANKIIDPSSEITKVFKDTLSSHINLESEFLKLSPREKVAAGFSYYNRIRLKPKKYETTLPGRGIDTTTESRKFILNNFLCIEEDKATILEDKQIVDLTTLLARWHIQNKNVLDIQETYVYSKSTNVQNKMESQGFQGDLPIVIPSSDSNKVLENYLYSYELYEWINEFAPSFLGSLPKNISFIGPATLSANTAVVDSTTSVLLLMGIQDFITGIAPVQTIEKDLTVDTFENFYQYMYDYKKMCECGGYGASETIFYKIEKFSGTTTNGNPVQVIVLPNYRESLLDYYDTQIIYGRDYTYRVSEVKAVLGCEYEYIRQEQPKELVSSGQYLLGVRQYPRVKIIEVPVFTRTVNCLARPPLPPEVQILPVRRKSNLVRFFFKPTYGTREMSVRSIKSEDDSILGKIALNNLSFKNTVECNDVTSVGSYEAYYSLEKPLNIYNIFDKFKNNLLFSVSTDFDPKTQQTADSAVAEINLVTNVKHYVTFIARNRLGIPSDPTAIYEMELIYDGGYSYLEFKEFNYQEEYDKNNSLSTTKMTKIMLVRPSPAQLQLDYIQSGLVSVSGNSIEPNRTKNNPLSFGILQDKIFPTLSPSGASVKAAGKTIKLRIRSKVTNKTVDINLKFYHERVQSEFERTPSVEIQAGSTTIKPPTGLNSVSNGTSGENLSPVVEGLEGNFDFCSLINPPVTFYYPETDETAGRPAGVTTNDLVKSPRIPTPPPPVPGLTEVVDVSLLEERASGESDFRFQTGPDPIRRG